MIRLDMPTEATCGGSALVQQPREIVSAKSTIVEHGMTLLEGHTRTQGDNKAPKLASIHFRVSLYGEFFFFGTGFMPFPEPVSCRFHAGFMGHETTPVSWHETIVLGRALVSCLVSCPVSCLLRSRRTGGRKEGEGEGGGGEEEGRRRRRRMRKRTRMRCPMVVSCRFHASLCNFRVFVV